MPERLARLGLVERVPLILTASRALLAPIVAGLSLYAPVPGLFAACLIAALLSDVFDGVIARRLNVATPTLRRLDSAADTLFYAGCVFAAWRLYPAAIKERWVPLCILVVLELLRYLIDFTKFRREASYHMWSSKLWGISLFVSFFWMLVLASTGVTVSIAIYAGIVADLEGVLISVLLPRWKSDVPTFFHALRFRKNADI
jgi:CDP-diacylglycerol--glycerol-3-phosphate 3-phosphatidyltransferase